MTITQLKTFRAYHQGDDSADKTYLQVERRENVMRDIKLGVAFVIIGAVAVIVWGLLP